LSARPGGARPRGAGPRRPLIAFTAPPFLPELHDDWPLARAALSRLDIDAGAVVWSDPAVDWTSFDLIVANGAWDNIHHPSEFTAWVDARERDGVPMVNSPATLRWNLDKRYLRELEAAGVPIVPTTWAEPGTDPAVELGEGEVVVKPSVSGGGFQTARYQPREHDRARAHVQALLDAGRPAMVQPYQHAVDTVGEVGLVFVGGVFSHAMHKDPMIRRGVGPAPTLIENQVVTPAKASPAQLELGRHAVAAAEQILGPAAYARVDTVLGADGRPVLLELELLDPVLFFTTDPGAADRFGAVLSDALAPVA
jgi:glutathione synthase/RimK-type ligase-like ATP-grasp enzyme